MAINSKSKLRDILADPRATAILKEVVPGLDENPTLGPCMGMRLSTLLKFPQVSVSPEDQKKLIEQLDALDA